MALTQTYVDPAINANSGTGTIGDPYGDLQYALNTMTRDASNGDQINVKAGTAEVLAASLTLATYGTPGVLSGLVIRGYTSAANDGGIGEINCNGAALFISIAYTYVTLIDLNLHTFGDNHGVRMGADTHLWNCNISAGASTPTAKRLISLSGPATIVGCYVHDPGASGIGIYLDGGNILTSDNYVSLGTGASAIGISTGGYTSATIRRNIVRCNQAGQIGINSTCESGYDNVQQNVVHNAQAGTGQGIVIANSYGRMGGAVLNNVVVGFSGAGGVGIKNGGWLAAIGYNAYYNNTTGVTINNTSNNLTAHDVSLAADPFTDAASGDFSLTIAGKAALRGVGWPVAYLGAHANTDGHVTIGAIQYGEAEAAADYPAETDVRDGVTYDAYTGSLDLPAVTDVQSGVTFDGATKTGTFAVPAVGDVQDGVTYGAAAEYTGTFAVPTEAQVEDGVGFGAGGTEFTGSLAATGAADWTAGEKEQIRQALGVTGTVAATSGTGTLEAAFAALADDTEVATAVAAAILVTPANKLATGAGGAVTTVTNLTNLPAAAALEATLTAMKGAGWVAQSLVSIAEGVSEMAADVPHSVVESFVTYDTGLTVVNIAAGSAADILRDAVSGPDGDTLKSLSDQSDTIAARLGAWTGTGVNTLLGAFKALLSKAASMPSDIGGTGDPSTDSTEAISEAVAAGGASIDPQDIANAALLTPVGVAAAGSQMAVLAAIPADVDTQLSGTHGAGVWGAGAGAFSQVYTVLVGGLPEAGVYCRMTTDLAGLVNVDAGTTNALGQVTFHHDLPSGTPVYIQRSKAGIEFDNPDLEQIP